MNPLDSLLEALHHDPGDQTAWLALADCLEEQGEPLRSELMRRQFELQTQARLSREIRTRKAAQTRVQELLAQGVVPCMPHRRFDVGRDTLLEVVLIPAGSFFMGAHRNEPQSFSDEHPRHRVQISRPFYLGIYPVTQAQWYAVTRRRPARFKGANRPVEQVTTGDAERFLTRLSERIGRQARLPTEAEWEYACRAGTSTPFSSGADKEAMERVGWGQFEETMPVGLKQPNGWGLYDMHGNVWEWCSDRFRAYTSEPQVDPILVPEDDFRVARGGSYSNPPFVCRSACRISFSGRGRNDFSGCRVAIDWE
ncbi:MAG: SUMF1/EgtB/PvdO family nonheme iron enzyme [Gemmataceae bacterium]